MSTTQTRNPWRTVARTVVQVLIPALIAAGVVIPMVVDIVLDQAGTVGQVGDQVSAVLLTAAAVTTAVSGALTRIMAIPQVETFLSSHRVVAWLAAEPYTGEHRAN